MPDAPERSVPSKLAALHLRKDQLMLAARFLQYCKTLATHRRNLLLALLFAFVVAASLKSMQLLPETDPARAFEQ